MKPAGYSEDHAHIPALIMGNGPSLAKIDFSALQGMATFGMNAAYRYWAEIDWWPDYYSCLDLVVGESHRKEIISLVDRADQLGIQKFLLRHSLIRSHKALRRSPRVTCYEQLLADGILPKLHDVTTGSHTLLWADRLGYSTLLLAGVDCNYTEIVEGATDRGTHMEIATSAPNPNYFFDGYQRPGDRFNRPNMTSNMHARSWANAARFLQPGTHVVNLNPHSDLQIFAKNLNENEPLAPGLLIHPPGGALDDEIAITDLADLRHTLRRCNRYRSAAPQETVRWYVVRAIQPSSVPAVKRWRPSGFQRTDASGTPDQLPQACSPYAMVSVRDIGDVVELDAGNNYDLTAHMAIHVKDSLGLKALEQLIQSVHEELGTPPVDLWLLTVAKRWLKALWRLAPIRLRSADYGRNIARLLGQNRAI